MTSYLVVLAVERFAGARSSAAIGGGDFARTNVGIPPERRRLKMIWVGFLGEARSRAYKEDNSTFSLCLLETVSTVRVCRCSLWPENLQLTLAITYWIAAIVAPRFATDRTTMVRGQLAVARAPRFPNLNTLADSKCAVARNPIDPKRSIAAVVRRSEHSRGQSRPISSFEVGRSLAELRYRLQICVDRHDGTAEQIDWRALDPIQTLIVLATP